MENFIYSINATLPVFFVMVIGWLLRQKNMLNENFVTVTNKFNFKVTLPILLFKDISSMNIGEVFSLKFFLFCFVVTIICFCSIWILSEIFIKDKTIIGSFVQGSFRGSAAVLGVAFIQNIYGNSGLAPLMIVSCVPLYNVFSVIVLTFKAKDNNQGGIQKIQSSIISIIKNPLIIGIMIGLFVSIFHIHIPEIATKTINNFAAMASPLALITIGAGFEGRKALAKIKPTVIASLIKLIIQPLIFLPIAIALGFRNQELIAILIMLGAPTTVSAYIMAKNMNNDGVLASSIVVLTTLLSSVTITSWIFILKSFGVL